ncbi:MAG TPA: S8 family serine peptidase [Chloroflexota bacterium]
MGTPTRLWSALLAGVLLSSALLPGLASAEPAPQVSLDPKVKMHPLLQYGAQADPLASERVIVQMTKADVKPRDIAARVPGLRIDEDFDVLPAFVASVPHNTLPLLASLPSVRYVSPDGAVQVISNAAPGKDKHLAKPKAPRAVKSKKHIDSTRLVTTFPFDTRATDAWSGQIDGHAITGSEIAVAVIDSGIDPNHPDLAGQVLAINVNRHSSSAEDGYGHGTHVAGVINGHDAALQYLGIAPNATLISVKIADDDGTAFESDLLRGLNWVYLYGDSYKIKALNLSVSVAIPESYATSPVNAAVERLWNSDVTVVASAGNLGDAQDAVWYAPGNDPYVITVGCLDDNGTVAPGDDSLCPISSRGVTEDGFAKPDLVAPGRKILSALASGVAGEEPALAAEFPDRVTKDGHIRLSGTSMAAPMVTGAVALLLQRKGDLTPGQIKQILTSTAMSYPGQLDRAGALNIAAALAAAEHPSAPKVYVPVPSSGVMPPRDTQALLWDGARWGNAYFDGARWGNAYFDGARWGAAEWDGARWGAAYWDGARWGAAYWNGARWGNSSFDGARWGNSRFDGARWGNGTWD